MANKKFCKKFMKKIYIDIDNTICITLGTDYSNAKPNHCNIEKVNYLYDIGHEITLWTARGTVTGIDWRSVTEGQLKKWNVKYHCLVFGKPAFDIFIDDKVLNTNNWTIDNVNKILHNAH